MSLCIYIPLVANKNMGVRPHFSPLTPFVVVVVVAAASLFISLLLFQLTLSCFSRAQLVVYQRPFVSLRTVVSTTLLVIPSSIDPWELASGISGKGLFRSVHRFRPLGAKFKFLKKEIYLVLIVLFFACSICRVLLHTLLFFPVPFFFFLFGRM